MMACEICGSRFHTSEVYEQRDGVGNVHAIVDTCPSPEYGPPLPFNPRDYPRPAGVDCNTWTASLFELWNETGKSYV